MYGTHSPELPEASPRNGGRRAPKSFPPFPLGGGGKRKTQLGEGEKKHTCLNKLRLNTEISHIFPVFFSKSCLFVCKMGIRLVFFITDKDFREPLIQMMLYDWVVTGLQLKIGIVHLYSNALDISCH